MPHPFFTLSIGAGWWVVSVAPILTIHYGIVNFRIVPTNTVVVDSVTSAMVHIKGRLYTSVGDLPEDYQHVAEKFEKEARRIFENAVHIVYVLSDKLYALVFLQGANEIEVVAYDVEEASKRS
jgi:hypothetical protein